MTETTPGPWQYEFVPSDEEEAKGPHTHWSGIYIGPLDYETGRIYGTLFEGGVTHGLNMGDPEADARLMATAPELLEALESIQLLAANHGAWVENGPIKLVSDIHKLATGAIQKARGEVLEESA